MLFSVAQWPCWVAAGPVGERGRGILRASAAQPCRARRREQTATRPALPGTCERERESQGEASPGCTAAEWRTCGLCPAAAARLCACAAVRGAHPRGQAQLGGPGRQREAEQDGSHRCARLPARRLSARLALAACACSTRFKGGWTGTQDASRCGPLRQLWPQDPSALHCGARPHQSVCVRVLRWWRCQTGTQATASRRRPRSTCR